MFEVQVAPYPALERALASHPRVSKVEVVPTQSAWIMWNQNGWPRAVALEGSELRGLIELQDNNPMVCADSVAVPSPAATLALIGIGPLSSAGILVEAPTMLTNASLDEEDLADRLATAGWAEGITAHSDEANLGTVYAATIVCAVQSSPRIDDFDDLFAERYGRSLYVHLDDSSAWDTQLVAGKPHASYRLRISPDDPHSLLTVQVMADRHGKCGASQIIHTFNVMCGFEESLGIG